MAGLDLAKVVTCDDAVRLDGRRVGARRRLPRRRASRASTSSPTTTASSTTSCACSPSAAAGSPSCRRRRPRREVLALQARRRVPLQRPRRSRSPATTRSRRSANSSTRGMPTFGICLGHQLLGARLGREDDEDEVRPPRREPSGAGPGHRPGADHQPEPRLRGRRDDAAGERARRRTSRCSTARCRASRAPTSRRSASRATRKRAPARTTSATCSTASSKMMEASAEAADA